MKYLILVTSLFSLPVYSNTVKQNENRCIVKYIDYAAQDRRMVSARELQRTCACNANKLSQGLSMNNCPTFSTIPDSAY